MKKCILYILLMASAIISLRATEENKPLEPTFRQKVYYFEHRLLPRWTHGTNGEFFSDLSKGAVERLLGAATDIVGKDFANELKVRPISDTQVLITFQKPSEPALCYFSLVQKRGQKYRYYTLELTEDLFGNGTKTVFGEWDEQGGHQNMGPRNYADEQSFIADIPQG